MKSLSRSGGLKPAGYVLLAVLAWPVASYAQETEPPDGTKIFSASVSGIDNSRLSPGLQEEIKKLAGTSLNRQVLREIASRIEAEQPRYVTAVRIMGDPDGEARVTFVVARIRDQGRDPNINTKYIVDAVEVKGVPDRDISPDLRKELQSLVGKPLDSDAADRLGNQLRAEFPTYDLHRATSRSDQSGHIKVVYYLRLPDWARWLRFEPLDGNALFHSDQGWGALLPLTISSRDVLVAPIFAWDTADDLVEEYSGFGIRVDARRLGSERVGLFFEWSTYDQEWRDQTLAALALNPQIPGAYRNRMTVTPMAKFAFTQQLSVAGGVGITELDPLSEELQEAFGLPSQMANVGIGSLRYKQHFEGASGSGIDHDVAASFTLRAGTAALQSDFEYDRYLTQANYVFRLRRHRVLGSAQFGSITGTAPLFERFTLGDSRTLRGWDKYDISPVGGDRMFHASAEYRFNGLMLFLDAGSVWDTGFERRVRFSTGAGATAGPVFAFVGFPLNTDEFRAVFSMGFRFGYGPLVLQRQ